MASRDEDHLSDDLDDDAELSFGDDDGDELSTPDENQDNTSGQAGAGGGGGLASFRIGGNAAAPNDAGLQNQPHDQAHEINDGENFATPRDGGAPAKVTATASASSASAGGAPPANAVKNKPFDMAFDVEDDEPDKKKAGGATGGASGKPAGGKAGHLQNQPSDFFEDVEDDLPDDDEHQPTPGRSGASAVPGGAGATGVPGFERPLNNNPHDVAVDVSSTPSHSPNNSVQTETPQSQQRPQQQQQQQQPQRAAGGWGAALASQSGGGGPNAQGSLASPPDDDEDEEEEFEEEEEDELGSGGGGDHSMMSQGGVSPGQGGGGGPDNTPVYNPDDYAHINSKVSQEVRDLFGYITAFQPTPTECPTKLRPFIPDFIPCIGDIDAFTKIPPPDGKPDNLGLVVLDEPSCPQSNATVVKNAVRSGLMIEAGSPVVDSVEDAHNRPQVLDQWIADIKSIRKPQTNVNYTKPMPDVTQLLQEWPPEFEALLSADVALPPANIDLDIFQYVRLVCTLVDIPTHGNLVESLHLLFQTYLEFRENQHFQHAG